MKKLYLILGIEFLVVFSTLLLFILPIWASCPIVKDKAGQYTTGAACSIKDSNLENSVVAGRNNLLPSKERNLRPVNPDKLKPMSDSCVLGLCLYKYLFEGEGEFKK